MSKPAASPSNTAPGLASATPCPGCGAMLPAVSAPEHPSRLASPACWSAYGELLAAQYDNPARMRFHQLVVDTYAVQHPGGGGHLAAPFVGINLMTLYLFLECGVDPMHGSRLHQLMVHRPVFHHLDPPASPGARTHLEVPRCGPVPAVRDAVYAWARDAWEAWSPHHDAVRRWTRESGLGSWTRRG